MPNILVAGKKRSGKTTWVKRVLIPQLLELGPVTAIDPKGWDYQDMAPNVPHPYYLLDAIQDGHQFVRWKPDPFTSKTNQAGEVLDTFCAGTDRVLEHHEIVSMIVEEAHNFQTAGHLYSANLDVQMRQGNSCGLNPIEVTQGMTDISRSTFDQVDMIISFTVNNIPDRLTDAGFDPTFNPSWTSGTIDITELPQYHYGIMHNGFQDNSVHRPISI